MVKPPWSWSLSWDSITPSLWSELFVVAHAAAVASGYQANGAQRGKFDTNKASCGHGVRIPSLGRRHLRPGPANNQAGDAGFSPERLGRIAKFFQAEVDKGALPGVTVPIARDGKIVYSQAVGFQDHEKKTPMKTDAIFRIASMSKPITSGAIMMLVEEGRIDLLAPVAQYLPEFKEGKVGAIKGEGANATHRRCPHLPGDRAARHRVLCNARSA